MCVLVGTRVHHAHIGSIQQVLLCPVFVLPCAAHLYNCFGVEG